ncbi:MAG TPA: ABC transporter permease [Gaiellales bacterium]|jgi:putative spermidine/putrescine transport system permease protein|nr:ABC transporter permease [Gaiellales bacterium]
MSTATATTERGPGGFRRRLSAYLYRRRPVKLLLLLTPPLGWILLVYIAALAVLLFTSLWIEDELSGRIIHTYTLDNFRQLWNDHTNWIITRNTLVMAIVVTITDAVLAFPLAYYMVRMASTRMRAFLFVGVLMPLWSSYLIKAYTWRLITAQDGPINWALGKVGLGPYHIAYTYTAMWLAFTYLWLPYMVLPVYAALERVPASFLEASSDLGGRAWITFRKVVWPLALPGIAAGSIFTFSLTLGDYVAPDLVGGNNHDFIGNVIFRFQGVAQDVPFAAAFACVPVVIVIGYLALMKRLGAFEAL